MISQLFNQTHKQMNRELLTLNTVKTVTIPPLFRNNTKSTFSTPKNLNKPQNIPKSKSKSLKKQYTHHSSTKSLIQVFKNKTPTNSRQLKLTQKISQKNIKKESIKEKKLIIIKNNSVKNLQNSHSKSTICLKNRNIQSSIKRKISQSQHIAPNSSRTSSFKQQTDQTLFQNSTSISSYGLKMKRSLNEQFPQSYNDLNRQFIQKRANVYKIFQTLDDKFSKIKDQDIISCSNNIVCRSPVPQKGIVSIMNKMSIDNTDNILNIIRNKIISPNRQNIQQKQNIGLLFQSDKINKIYVSNYKRRKL